MAKQLMAAMAILMLVAVGRGSEQDVQALLRGVDLITSPGIPGPICVYGPDAFAIIGAPMEGDVQAPAVAAGRLGKGRVVALGHTGYFEKSALSAGNTAAFMHNAIRWSSAKDAPSVGVHREGGFAAHLREARFNARDITTAELGNLVDVDVLCLSAHSLRDDQIEPVARFVRDGGGLVVSGLAWGWLQLNPGKTIGDHPGNRLLAPAGILYADGYLRKRDDAGFKAEPASALLHAAKALDFLAAGGGEKAAIAQASATLTLAAQTLPASDTIFLPRLIKLAEKENAVPTPSQGLSVNTPLPRVVAGIRLRQSQNLPASNLKPMPGAEAFPGPVPADASRIQRTIRIDTAVEGWHSTGLYAAPGEIIRIELPAGVESARMAVRIGAHADRIWHLTTWKRYPEISRSWPLSQRTMEVASPFGGLIYIEAPRQGGAGSIELTIANAIPAAFYELGKTGLAQWRSQIRQHPAPWAELAGRRVILTVPADAIRKLDDPQALMQFWDGVIDRCAELAGIPADRPHPERYVADVQISAGYMHSGYPIMTHLDAAAAMVDLNWLKSGREPVWGLYHEVGHNHQSSDWTFDGTVEVTVNLFTRYVLENACGIPLPKQRSIDPKKVQAYLAAPDFEQWKQDPFLALAMYDRIIAEFGWDAIRKTIAEYRTLPADQRPKTDAQKRDQWMVRLSRTTGRNLGPFFAAWGVPVSEEARKEVAKLPEWR